MKKRSLIVVGLVLSLSLLVSGSAFARWNGYGMMGGNGMMNSYDYDMMRGYGNYDRGVNVEAIRKFQSETLGMRDELYTKQLELNLEYSKAAPKADRITQLRKDIIDIEGKIQVVAEKNNMPVYNRGGNGRWSNRGCY